MGRHKSRELHSDASGCGSEKSMNLVPSLENMGTLHKLPSGIGRSIAGRWCFGRGMLFSQGRLLEPAVDDLIRLVTKPIRCVLSTFEILSPGLSVRTGIHGDLTYLAPLFRRDFCEKWSSWSAARCLSASGENSVLVARSSNRGSKYDLKNKLLLWSSQSNHNFILNMGQLKGLYEAIVAHGRPYATNLLELVLPLLHGYCLSLYLRSNLICIHIYIYTLNVITLLFNVQHIGCIFLLFSTLVC